MIEAGRHYMWRLTMGRMTMRRTAGDKAIREARARRSARPGWCSLRVLRWVCEPKARASTTIAMTEVVRKAPMSRGNEAFANSVKGHLKRCPFTLFANASNLLLWQRLFQFYGV